MRDFDSEFDKLCQKKREEKERKKKTFNENIKSHIVYMDDDGNIIKNPPRKASENKPTDGFSKLIAYFLIVLLVVFIFYQIKPLVMCLMY